MSDTYTQDLMWTVLPFGQSSGSDAGTPLVYLDFSVIVSPRLHASDPAPTELSHYPDWVAGGVNGAGGTAAGRTWPDTVAALASGLALHLPDLPGAPTYPADLIGARQPDAARFATIFPASTPVTPYAYQGFEDRVIRSAPVGTAVDVLAGLYGRFGLSSPTQFPPYTDLVPADAFGPLGFQQSYLPGSVALPPDPGIPGSGPARKQALQQVLEDALKSAKAIPYDLTALAASLDPAIPGAVKSLAFLQHQRFLQRGLPATSAPTEPPPAPAWDFHQMYAGLGSLPTLLRILGLVLDLRAGPVDPAVVAAWHDGVTGRAQFVMDQSRFLTTTNNVLPAVQSIFGPGVFRPAPKDPANTDLAGRLLKLGDQSLYRIVRVDHDNGIVKAMQFANSVTRSRADGRPLTPSTPDRFALPALRTGGFAIARSGRATQIADTLAHQTNDLERTYFSGGTLATPPLFEEDITRGYRIDVLHESDGIWRSLMWRQGTITVDGADPIPVVEEDTVVPAPTTASRRSDDPGDLYLQETLTRWDGWSLAVPRIGSPFQNGGPSSSANGSSGFNVTTDWQVPGSSSTGAAETPTDNARRLPRLRFGESYRLRARAADLAGNALPVETAAADGVVVSPSLRHLRFEPVAAPRLLLVSPPLPGASEEVVVIRSESAAVTATSSLDNASATRVVVPAPTSVFLAEQHDAFDLALSGRPMNQAAAAYQAIAARDAVKLDDDGALADPAEPHGTANPYLFPGFLPINYLPDVLGRSALVRGLPPNANKERVAQLPFDTAGQGWPRLQAARIVLSRGTPTWSTRVVTDPKNADNVTTELDLRLAKGDMITTLVNCHLDPPAAEIMAIWEWIQQWASANGVDPAPAGQAILAGEHWMVTPWRQVTFVHAVRTPLARPRLFLLPTKSAIGQTHATFDGAGVFDEGTVLMSRKSTAKVDVDGTWAMPIDNGTNTDPVTPQTFQGHAFTVDLTREGLGVDPTAIGATVVPIPNAENFLATHEFNDTKFRAVTYRGTATSYYVEFFRQQLTLPLGDDPITALKAAAVKPGVSFEATTAELTLTWHDGTSTRSRRLVAAPPGSTGPGDFVVVEDPMLASDPAHATNGTVQVLAGSSASSAGLSDASVTFSYVGPTIHTFSDPAADHTTAAQMLVPNSARPKAPDVLYIVPIYSRSETATTVTRVSGAVRVYLNRPWWSSGDEERLGVVCWHPASGANPLPPDDLAPYVTLWGFDPIFKSTTALPGQPTPACFPLRTAGSSNGSLTIEEASANVDVAGHPVGYDSDRGLWYCDIQVTGPNGKELASYTPFIRFALARYQPTSIPNAHLSKVVLADYAQLAPNRYVTVTGSGTSRKITVAGRGPRATDTNTKTSQLLVLVEEHDDRITDDALAWLPATGPNGFANRVELTASASDTDYITWTGTVHLPQGNPHALRFTFEEFERLSGGSGDGRLVFTETFPLNER